MNVSARRRIKKIRVNEKLYADIVRHLIEKYGVVGRHMCSLIDEALKRYLMKNINNPQLPSGFTSRHYVHRFGRYVNITTTISEETEKMFEEYIKELSKTHKANYGLRRAIAEEALTEYLKGETHEDTQ